MASALQLRCLGDDCSFAFASNLSSAPPVLTHCSGASPPAHPFPPASPPIAPPSSPPPPLPPPSPSPLAPRPAPPSSPPPDTVPSSLTSLSVTEVGETTLTIAWSAPSDDGGQPISSFRAWACDAESGACFGAEAADWMRGLTLTALPSGRNYTVAVEAYNAVGSSGNATVLSSSGRGRAAVFTTLSAPAAGLPAALAAPMAALDNETSLHLVWWAPFDNGAPLTQHELLVAVGADAVDAGLDAALALASAGAAQVACTAAAAACSADDGSSAPCWLDAACWAGSEHSGDCGAAGHPLCRWCDGLGQEACPAAGARHQLGDDAAALVGGALRVRVSHAAEPLGGWQQLVLLQLVRGTTHQVAVRARNSFGWGPYSAPAGLRTAGEPPPPPSLLELDAAAALSAEEDAAGVAGGAAGAAFVLLCCCICWGVRRFFRQYELQRRNEEKEALDAEAEAAEAEAADTWPELPTEPKARLTHVLSSGLASHEMLGIDDAPDVQVNTVLVHLAKQDAKRKAEEAHLAKKAAEAAARAATLEESGGGNASTSSSGHHAADATSGGGGGLHGGGGGGAGGGGGGGARQSKYNFVAGRNLGAMNFSLAQKKKRCGGGAGGAGADAPTVDQSSAAGDVKSYLTRSRGVEALGRPTNVSEEAAERNRPRLERQAAHALERADDVSIEGRMSEVAHKVRTTLEMHQALMKKWKAASQMSRMYCASRYAVAYAKDPSKVLGRKLTPEEEKERATQRGADRKSKAMSRISSAKAAREQAAGAFEDTGRISHRVKIGCANSSEKEEEREEARASAAASRQLRKDGPGRATKRDLLAEAAKTKEPDQIKV